MIVVQSATNDIKNMIRPCKIILVYHPRPLQFFRATSKFFIAHTNGSVRLNLLLQDVFLVAQVRCGVRVLRFGMDALLMILVQPWERK